MHLKMSSEYWRPFDIGLNVLRPPFGVMTAHFYHRQNLDECSIQPIQFSEHCYAYKSFLVKYYVIEKEHNRQVFALLHELIEIKRAHKRTLS